MQSNVIQAASKVDSTQGIFYGINTFAMAWCQLTRTRTSNIAGNAAANPRKQSVVIQSTSSKTTANNAVVDKKTKGT